ncbi:innexin inx2 [Ixodes scapularis]
MDKLLGGLKNLIKIDAIVTDNHVFRLHYKVTCAVLIAFSILVTSRQYIGDPIDCISKDSLHSKVLDTFCWIHSTFSVKDAWNKKAVLFYIPRYLWLACEGNKISTLVLDLNSPVLCDDKRKCSRKLLVEYFINNIGHHKMYTLYYFICEILNFVNVIGQIYLMDDFPGGEFSTYGTKVLEFTDWDWSVRFDPMIKVFPRLTKCTFHMYGSSGDVMKHDAMCILPINIIDEKIDLRLPLVLLPRYFWKAIERGRVKNLILGLNKPILFEEAKENSKKLLVEYRSINLNNHDLFFNSYVAAKVMNFVNVVGQMFLMDMFLGGEISSYGSKVLQFTEW